jgi:hypothetical protein
MKTPTYKELKDQNRQLIKSHILITRHNVMLLDMIEDKDKVIDMQQGVIAEFIERDSYLGM